MNYYERAVELKQETINHRRYFHTNAEVGLNNPKAVDEQRSCRGNHYSI